MCRKAALIVFAGFAASCQLEQPARVVLRKSRRVRFLDTVIRCGRTHLLEERPANDQHTDEGGIIGDRRSGDFLELRDLRAPRWRRNIEDRVRPEGWNDAAIPTGRADALVALQR